MGKGGSKPSLASCGSPAQEDVFEVRSEHVEEAVGVMTRSFSGTAGTDPEMSVDWLLGPHLRSLWDDPRRVLMTEYLMRSRLSLNTLKGGISFAARKPDGAIGAVCLAKPYINHRPPGAIKDFMIEGQHALFHVGLPPCGIRYIPCQNAQLRNDVGRGIERRMEELQAKLIQMKGAHGREMHWYVDIMAVDPNAQGCGLCGKLMRTVSKMADVQGVQCLLNSNSARNNAVYEHLGYQVAEYYELRANSDPDGSDPFTTFCAMVRPAKAATGGSS